MTLQYKLMCGCECCISVKIMQSSLLSWREHYLKNLKITFVTRKTEGLMKLPTVYLRHIKIRHATW